MIIAIDGYSSCGKSTLAKDLAKILSLIYVDTGAMYRAVTLYFIENHVDLNDSKSIIEALDHISIAFQRIGDQNTTFLNGKNVEEEIRQLKVSALVSEVSAIPEVRHKLVAEQRAMASEGLIMDGRDIGTVVFPNADFKFYLTADHKIRTNRRFEELRSKGLNTSWQEVNENLAHRDHIDTHRSHSPLSKAEDAIEIDNTHLTKQEQIELVLEYILQKNKQ